MKKIVDKIDTLFTVVGMICLFSIAVIIAVDGLGRHFFHSPIVGAYVLVEQYLMVAMIFPVMSYTWASNGHISVNLFYDKMSQIFQNIVYLFTICCALFIIGLIGYTGIESTWDALIGRNTTSGLIRWPLWASFIWMPIGCAVFCLRLLVELITMLRHLSSGGWGSAFRPFGSPAHEGVD